MRNTIATLFIVLTGFCAAFFAPTALRHLSEAREAHLDIDQSRGEVLFFTADW